MPNEEFVTQQGRVKLSMEQPRKENGLPASLPSLHLYLEGVPNAPAFSELGIQQLMENKHHLLQL